MRLMVHSLEAPLLHFWLPASVLAHLLHFWRTGFPASKMGSWLQKLILCCRFNAPHIAIYWSSEDEDLENGANIGKQTFVVFSEAYFGSKKGDDGGESFAAGSRELL